MIEAKIGDHVAVARLKRTYSHHGIYIGNDEVIHFTGEMFKFQNSKIQKDTVSTFLNGGRLVVVQYPPDICFESEVVVERAFQLLEKKGVLADKYSLFNNNCEHFSVWTKTGIPRSLQVQTMEEGISVGMDEGYGTVKKYSPSAFKIGLQASFQFGKKSVHFFKRGIQGILLGLVFVIVGGLVVLILTALRHYFTLKDKHHVVPKKEKRIKHHNKKIDSIVRIVGSNRAEQGWVKLLLDDLFHIDTQLATIEGVGLDIIDNNKDKLYEFVQQNQNDSLISLLNDYNTSFLEKIQAKS